MAVVDQIAVLHAVTRGLFDGVPPGMMAAAEARLHAALRESPGGVLDAIEEGEELDEEKCGHLERLAAEVVESVVPQSAIHGDG